MIINPIIPVWLMGIICVILLLLKRKGMKNYIRQILVVVLLFVINLRIMVANGEATTVMTNVDVLFVVDNTISMLAEDYEDETRRIDAVKVDCNYIMEQMPGASFSVVSFANSVQTLIPYTVDYNNVMQALNTLNGQGSLYAMGTSLNDVLDAMEEMLDNDKDNYKIVFFISDGEITNEEKLKSYPELKNYIDAGAVLGYGTREGGPMKTVAFTGDEEEPEYLYYYEGLDEKKAISKMDEENLKKIASDFGVSYVHMTEQSQIDDILERIQEEIKYSNQENTEQSTDGYSDIYYWFVIPLVLLLVIDFIYYKRKIKM